VYAGLHDTVETCRNTCCHGGIHKRGAAIAVHVERIGAVPTALTSEPRRISMFIRLRRSRSPTSPGSVSTSMAATDSVIGLGTWPLGGRAYGPVSCANAIATIAAALHAGTSFFDTADIYGDGRAEELLGAALPPPGCLVATKVGYLTERGSDQDFGPRRSGSGYSALAVTPRGSAPVPCSREAAPAARSSRLGAGRPRAVPPTSAGWPSPSR
jgi:hypothetical protein